MREGEVRVGFAFCGSYCTYGKAMEALEAVAKRWPEVTPIVAESGCVTDTRFGAAGDWLARMEAICGKYPLTTIAQVEPIGPKNCWMFWWSAPVRGIPWASWPTVSRIPV